MNQLIYRLMYLLSHPAWDSGKVPPELVEAFTGDDIPAGPALDLGCGTGTNVIYMAQHGREALGIDYIPEAIQKARKKAGQAGVSGKTRFLAADVTKLARLDLPVCSFALDMGCFHGLTPQAQQAYVEGLAAQLRPGSRFMLWTLDPVREAGISFGITPEAVHEVFAPRFDILKTARDNSSRRVSAWFWMRRA